MESTNAMKEKARERELEVLKEHDKKKKIGKKLKIVNVLISIVYVVIVMLSGADTMFLAVGVLGAAIFIIAGFFTINLFFKAEINFDEYGSVIKERNNEKTMTIFSISIGLLVAIAFMLIPFLLSK